MSLYFAARVPEVNLDTGEVRAELVVVLAESPLDARRETGLLDADFSPATPRDLEEWEDEAARPLTRSDVRDLLSFVRRHQVGMFNRGRRSARARADRRLRYKARKLAQLRGKLELMLVELEEDDTGATFDNEEVA